MSPVSHEANAELVRLRRSGNAVEVSNALTVLLRLGESLDQAARIVEERIKRGDYVLTQPIAHLLVATRSESLYRLSHDQIFRDEWALIDLYKGRYPDKQIEEHLINVLYQISSDDANPRRSYIVQAMQSVGSIDILPDLEALLYDLAPTKSTKRVIADALFATSGPTLDSTLANLIAHARADFMSLLVNAIKSIRERGADEPDSTSNVDSQESRNARIVTNSHTELEKAKAIVNDDPTYALVCLRRGAEAMGKHLYRHLRHEERGKPASKMMLDELLKPIRESTTPEIFKICMQALQPFGNYAAHDQDDGFHGLNSDVGNALIVLYREALDAYEQWLTAQLQRDA